jgi:hypothetical protein
MRQRTTREGFEGLRRELALVLKREVERYNGAQKEGRFRIQTKERPDALIFAGRTYKKELRDGRCIDVPCAFHLNAHWEQDRGTVEFTTDPAWYNGVLSSLVGADGSLSFFEGPREVTVAQASRSILTRFLDGVEKPEI